MAGDLGQPVGGGGGGDSKKSNVPFLIFNPKTFM